MTPITVDPVVQAHALALLKRFYGYTSFRPGQYEVIQTLVKGGDALVLMPTGGGKSLCYQIPALLAECGCAVVVSPLIALMQDQTQALLANGIPAAAIHSNQPEADNRRILESAARGRIKLLYVSPERLVAELEGWKNLEISLFAIDEAHCISQWGHDFRPDYAALECIKRLRPEVPMVALTATADRLTRDDIAGRLGLVNPYFYLSSFDRPNISLRVFNNPGARERAQFIARLARKYSGDSGVAYCLSRANVDSLHAALTRLGVRSVRYHAGMNAQERSEALRAFLDGTAQVVCATVAFGMGIDKSNIRWVVHNNLPADIESYYQEIGRAGRDGLPAEAVLFHSVSDIIARRNFALESGRQAINLEKLERMRAFAEARVCRRRILLSYFSEETTHDCGNCDVCLQPPERFDGTRYAQMAISAVARTGWTNLGAFTLANILHGSRTTDIVAAGYDRIKTFGVGHDLTFRMWTDYIQQMIQLGVFEIAYDNANHLRVTPFGMKLLRGEADISLARYVAPAAAEKKEKKKKAPAAAEAPVGLFEYLKKVRLELARREKVPPYILFNDASLRDMASRRPASMDELLEVYGVGEVKASRYGSFFLEAIRGFSDRHVPE